MSYFVSLLIYVFASIFFLFFGIIILILTIIYPPLLFRIIIPWCKTMIYIFGCQIISNGKIPSNETFVIMANHTSFLDVFAIPTVLTGKFSAVAASKNFKIPIYSTFLKKMKVVSIDRSNRTQAIKGIKKAEMLLKNGYHIVILPEGTRTHDGKLGKFKKGGFHLAINTHAKILPIITKGLYEIKPINRWTIKPGLITINVGNPIDAKNKKVDDLLEETRNQFTMMLDEN